MKIQFSEQPEISFDVDFSGFSKIIETSNAQSCNQGSTPTNVSPPDLIQSSALFRERMVFLSQIERLTLLVHTWKARLSQCYTDEMKQITCLPPQFSVEEIPKLKKPYQLFCHEQGSRILLGSFSTAEDAQDAALKKDRMDYPFRLRSYLQTCPENQQLLFMRLPPFESGFAEYKTGFREGNSYWLSNVAWRPTAWCYLPEIEGNALDFLS